MDAVAVLIRPDEVGVELPDVLTQAKTKGPAKQLEWFEPLSADAVVIEGHLAGEIRILLVPMEIDRLVELEHVRAPPLDRTIPSAVGANYDVLRHGGPPECPASDMKDLPSPEHRFRRSRLLSAT